MGEYHEYRAMLEVARWHNLDVVDSPDAGADDWVRMVDAMRVIKELENKLAICQKENEQLSAERTVAIDLLAKGRPHKNIFETIEEVVGKATTLEEQDDE